MRIETSPDRGATNAWHGKKIELLIDARPNMDIVDSNKSPRGKE